MKNSFNNSGFGVIEVVVSLALTAILVVSLGNVIGSVHRIYGVSENKARAYAFAQEPIEILNVIKNEYFACICDISGSCSGDICTSSADSQVCTLRDGYTTCWLLTPKNLLTATTFYVIQDNGVWQLRGLAPGARESVLADPFYTREIIIANVPRNVDGNIDPAGTITNYDTKKITVNVYWNERGIEKNVSISTILTAWQNL